MESRRSIHNNRAHTGAGYREILVNDGEVEISTFTITVGFREKDRKEKPSKPHCSLNGGIAASLLEGVTV
jgi:hypothetical protein